MIQTLNIIKVNKYKQIIYNIAFIAKFPIENTLMPDETILCDFEKIVVIAINELN